MTLKQKLIYKKLETYLYRALVSFFHIFFLIKKGEELLIIEIMV